MAVQMARVEPENHVLFHTDWNGYLKILSALGEHRGGIRVTYDRGAVEIMTTSDEHGHLVRLMGHLLSHYLEACHIAYRFGGVQTLKRKDLDRGTEPDDCFWISTARRMVGVKRWNPRIHPPPDLALEVTVTHGFISRIPIYAALRIPEVWWHKNGKIQILRLQEQGEYKRAASSPTLPGLSPHVLARHIAMSDEVLDSDIVEQFRAWLRTHIAKVPPR